MNEVKLEALKLALGFWQDEDGAISRDVIRSAEEFYEFLLGEDEEEEETPDSEGGTESPPIYPPGMWYYPFQGYPWVITCSNTGI